MNLNSIEKSIVRSTRFLTIVAVLGSLAGSVLMFILGTAKIFLAFRAVLRYSEDPDEPYDTQTLISVIEALDRYLIAIVLLYFSYGVYSLFIRPREREEALALPAWLHIRQIGQLKQVVAELIIVILFVLFLRLALLEYAEPGPPLSWREIANLLVLPISIVLLGLALRLVALHPKSVPPHPPRSDGAPGDQPGRGNGPARHPNAGG